MPDKIILKQITDIEGKKYRMNVDPHNLYCWDLPEKFFSDNSLSMPLSILINTFLETCTPQQKLIFKEKRHYLRFMCFQDTPDSKPYVYGYLKAIEACTFEDHKFVLNSISKECLPCEINFGTFGVFAVIPREIDNIIEASHIVFLD